MWMSTVLERSGGNFINIFLIRLFGTDKLECLSLASTCNHVLHLRVCHSGAIASRLLLYLQTWEKIKMQVANTPAYSSYAAMTQEKKVLWNRPQVWIKFVKKVRWVFLFLTWRSDNSNPSYWRHSVTEWRKKRKILWWCFFNVTIQYSKIVHFS